MTMGSPTGFPQPEHHPLSTFSALNLLRNYNQLLNPSGANLVQIYHHYSCRSSSSFGEFSPENQSQQGNFQFPPVIGAFHPYTYYPMPTSPSLPDLKSKQSYLSTPPFYTRRPRGEKKPIPDDQKDDRYYERRKRNNQAAKKSRDARKFREDQIALRATLLEHENAVLRAQIITLREETQTLREQILKENMSEKIFYGKTMRDNGKVDVVVKKYKSEFESDH